MQSLFKKGEGIHHIAFEVEDIYTEIERLKKEGFILLSNEPKNGADNKLVCFLHPKNTNSVLIEICQQKNRGSILLPQLSIFLKKNYFFTTLNLKFSLGISAERM